MIRWPNIGLWGNFEPCEEGILAAINQNFFILDLLVQMKIIDFVDELPADPLDGDAYILTDADDGGAINDIMVWDGNAWVKITPEAGYMGYVNADSQFYWFNGTSWIVFPTTLGDVSGPASSTDNAVARYNGTTGKIIQNSGVIISDTDDVSGIQQLTSVASTTVLGKAGITRTDLLEGLLTIDSTSAGSSQALSTPITLVTRFTGSLNSIASIGVAPTALYGRLQIFINGRDSNNITFTNGSSIVTGTNSDLVVKPGAAIWMYYDSSISRWIVIGGSGGGAGGLIVADNTALLAIPSGDRFDGLNVHQLDEHLNWQYQGGVADANLVLLNNYPYVYPTAQTPAAASPVTLTAGIFYGIIKVSSSVSGGGVVTLPSGRRNGEVLGFLGNSNVNQPTIQEASNVIQNGDFAIQLNQLVEYVWFSALTAWVKKGV